MRISENDRQVSGGPLVSWDIYLEGYRKAQTLADDKLALEKLALAQQWKHKFNFAEQLFKMHNAVLVTTPTMKIVYASSNIEALTGYRMNEVVGSTPHIFQGSETDTSIKAQIRQSVDKRTYFEATLKNYRKDGSMYTCYIKGFPIFNRDKKLVNYIAFEKEVPTV
jgi:PAS domain S-box-containing protein